MGKKDIKISIIIPTIGRETLKKVLESIFFNVDFDQINPEILLVFDGDISKLYSELSLESKKVLEQAQGDPRIAFFETRKNLGAAKARNLGIKKSTGDVLIFIGDDTIPEKDWLLKTYEWHLQNPKKEKVLLGKVKWVEALAKDPFHLWLEKNAQFDFGRLDKDYTPDWKHFYTSNISVKKELLNIAPSLHATPLNLRECKLELFSEQFVGWGFEDSEFGYRLEKKGMQIFYKKGLVVYHDHKQTLEGVIEQTKSARKNAKVFERLHPEIKILPRRFKLFILRILILKLFIPSKFNKKIYWWREWKKAWLGC